MSTGASSGLLFSPESESQFGREFCFLCGAMLPTDRATDEHVIPKWVQDRFGLWDEKLTLLNRTTIPYRLLTIPCCSPCNSQHLSRIEREVQQACAAGRKAVLALEPLTLFIWLGKIFYGLLYREHLLSWNRRAREDGPIVPADELEQFRLHHQFLQAARIPFEFIPHIPASVFVFETLEPRDRRMQFDYLDHFFSLGLSIRVGKVGVVACLQDGRAVRDSFDYTEYETLRLHPIQFAEITARIFYDLSRLNRVPKFMLVEGNGRVHVALTPMGGLIGGPLFDKGNLDDYAHALAHYARFPVGQLHPESDKVISWLRYPDGRLKQMRPDDSP